MEENNDLEQKLRDSMHLYGVTLDNKKKVFSLLDRLGDYHLPTKEHSIRVGLLASSIANYMNIDPKPAVYACLHDVGKMKISLNILGKTSGFNGEDMEVMKAHAMEGYKILREEGLLFSSWLAVDHHQFQLNKYPTALPELPFKVCEGTKLLLNIYPRIISLADHYDALKRQNERFARVPTYQEARKILIETNRDQEYFINKLYMVGIF